jgi:hypothetical protein
MFTTPIAALTPSLRELIQKLREGFAMNKEFQNGDADVIESGVKTLDRADGEVIALGREEELIQADPDLSDEGRRKAMTKAVGRAYAELAFVQKTAREKANAASSAQQTLEAIPKSTDDPLLDYLRSFEVRQELRKLSQPERMHVFSKATEDKNTAILRAIASDPFGQTLIEPEFARRVTEERLQLTEGAQWQRWKTLVFVSERLTLLANALEYRLKNYGVPPLFSTPPSRTSDLKMQNITAPPEKASRGDQPPDGLSSFQ